MATSGLSCGNPLVGTGWAISLLLCMDGPLVGTGWAISLLLCMDGLRKQSSGHVGPPFLAVELFSRSVRVTIGDY